MDDDLVRTYIRYQREHRDEDFWAWVELDELVLTDPDKAWQTILAIIHQATDHHTLAALGAGGLENLLWRHGVAVKERVLTEAAKNEKLLQSLSRSNVSEPLHGDIEGLLARFNFKNEDPPLFDLIGRFLCVSANKVKTTSFYNFRGIPHITSTRV